MESYIIFTGPSSWTVKERGASNINSNSIPLRQQIQNAVKYIQQQIQQKEGGEARPISVGIILGSGMGGFVDNEVEDPIRIPFGDIPHFAGTPIISNQRSRRY